MGYLAKLGAAGAGCSLFINGGAVNGLQAAALRLAWAMGTHPRAASPALALVDDVLGMVGETVHAGVVVVHDVAGLRAAVADDSSSAPAVIELDPQGTFVLEEGSTLDIEREVRLVSGAGGLARIVGDETSSGSRVVGVRAEGVTLEGLAVVSGGYGGGAGCPARMQQTAVEIQRGGAAVMHGCDLAGTVKVYGVAELHGCVVHDCSQDGVLVADESARAVLVDTAVERCYFGVVVDKRGVVSLRGNRNTVCACEMGDYTVVKGRIEGVALELVNHW